MTRGNLRDRSRIQWTWELLPRTFCCATSCASWDRPLKHEISRLKFGNIIRCCGPAGVSNYMGCFLDAEDGIMQYALAVELSRECLESLLGRMTGDVIFATKCWCPVKLLMVIRSFCGAVAVYGWIACVCVCVFVFVLSRPSQAFSQGMEVQS